MKKSIAALLLLEMVASAHAAATIDPANHYAYAANFGWLDFRGDTTNGVILGEYTCSGYIYSANVGWISLGSGTPVNGIRYQNSATNDFGVNHDGFGNLSGYAYAANIGWINFETNGAPKINLQTGNLSGSVYSANCGWISLSNAVAHVQTDTLSPGALDASGLPIPWELTYFGTTGISASADPDHDGQSNLQEYLAGTNPTDANSNLRVTMFGALAGGTSANLTWTSVLSRNYHIQQSLDLTTPIWTDSNLGLIAPDGNTTSRAVSSASAPTRYYRVNATLPLAP